jgi:GntR family transcriptional regulator
MGGFLSLNLERDSGVPLYVQIERQIELLIQQGGLKPGDLMPTVRALAVELSINSNTVSRVYRDLQHAGILTLKRGVGTFVSETVTSKTLRRKELEQLDTKVDSLISLCRRLQISPFILSQLIESRWNDGHRHNTEPQSE